MDTRRPCAIQTSAWIRSSRFTYYSTVRVHPHSKFMRRISDHVRHRQAPTSRRALSSPQLHCTDLVLSDVRPARVLTVARCQALSSRCPAPPQVPCRICLSPTHRPLSVPCLACKSLTAPQSLAGHGPTSSSARHSSTRISRTPPYVSSLLVHDNRDCQIDARARKAYALPHTPPVSPRFPTSPHPR